MTEPIKHLFFDLDRTLWDFESNSRAALYHLFYELQLEKYIPSFEVFLERYKKINANYWEDYAHQKVSKEALRVGRFYDTLQEWNIHQTPFVQKLSEGYVAISPHQTNLFPGTIDTLTDLKDKGYPLHIITNGFKEVQFIKLEKSGLNHFFEDVLCSEEIGVNKPDPRVFQAALQRNKAKNSQSIMIGDDFKADVIGAEKAGMRGVLFDPSNHFQQREEIERIQSLTELPLRLLGL